MRDEGLGFIIKPSSTMHIMAELLPRRFKMPHLENFKMLILLCGAIEGVLCWVFPSTLRKSA